MGQSLLDRGLEKKKKKKKCDRNQSVKTTCCLNRRHRVHSSLTARPPVYLPHDFDFPSHHRTFYIAQHHTFSDSHPTLHNIHIIRKHDETHGRSKVQIEEQIEEHRSGWSRLAATPIANISSHASGKIAVVDTSFRAFSNKLCGSRRSGTRLDF